MNRKTKFFHKVAFATFYLFVAATALGSVVKTKVVQEVTLATLCLFIAVMVLGSVAAADRDVIIGYNKPVGIQDDDDIQSHGGKVKKDFHVVSAISANITESGIEELKKNPRIKYVVNNTIYAAAGITIEYNNSWGVKYIGTQLVHDQGINGSGVKVAVLDTGINYTNPDLAGVYKGGYDFIYNDTDPWDDNCRLYGSCHGTHVSGIIAAQNNGFGVIGVAPGVDIYAVKVLDAAGFGSAEYVLSGIEWAYDHNMDIISMSLGSTENNTAVFDAVNAAYKAGIILVASSGNTRGNPALYPAAYDSVIGVTAIDALGKNTSFSPIDPTIEIAAPGVSVYSTADPYRYLSGTSMAAPHVTGVIALILSAGFSDVNGDGITDNKDVRQIIDDSARDTGVLGRDAIYGYGILDASNAVLGISSPYINVSIDTDLEDIKNLVLLRTKGSPKKDSVNVSLQGRYIVNVTNINLSELEVHVFDNGTIRKNLSIEYEFEDARPGNRSFEIYDEHILDVVFTPYGRTNSTAKIKIKKID